MTVTVISQDKCMELEEISTNCYVALMHWLLGDVVVVFKQVIFKHKMQMQFMRISHETGPRLNIKTVLSTYGDFHVKDKTAVRTSYL